MKLPPKLAFSHPALRLLLNVSYEEIRTLNSFERIIFQVVSEFSMNFDGLSLMLPFDVQFLDFFIARYEASGHIEIKDDHYVLTTKGSADLAQQKLRVSKSKQIEVIYDPIKKEAVGVENISWHNRPKEFIENTKFYERGEISKDLGLESIRAILTQQEAFEILHVSSIHIEEIHKCSIPILIHLKVEKSKFFLEFSNGDVKRNYKIQSVLNLVEEGIYRMSPNLHDYFLNIIKAQSQFYKEMLAVQFKELPVYKSLIAKFSDIPADDLGIEILIDKDHSPDKLIEFIQLAQNEIYIASGWIKRFVVNEIFTTLEQRLKDGIKINLLYGFENESNTSSDEAVGELKKLAEVYSNLKVISVHKTFHQKGIVVDDRIVVIGSYNWLSNSGKVSQEASFVIKNQQAALMAKEYMFDVRIKNSAKVA